MERYLLGVDVGTSSLKLVVIDQETNIIAASTDHYRINEEKPMWKQIDSKDLWRAFKNCLKKLSEITDLHKVSCIGISALCPGLTAFDSDGNILVDPIIYSDQRSVKEAQEIIDRAGSDRIFEITGNSIMAGAMSCTSMLWIKNNLPETYKKTHYFGHVNTLLAAKMTGKYAIDYSNASYTALFEVKGGYQWSQELCDKIGIDIEKLPPLHHSTDIIGGLISKDLIDIGLLKDTPVIIGGGDTACASLACGVVHDSDVCESAGTTNVLTVCVTKPEFNRGFINRCHVVDGAWIYQGALSYTGASLQWCRDELCKDISISSSTTGKEPYYYMDQLAIEKSAPGANGLVFLPYMLGERSPIWDSLARGVFFGLSMNSTRADLIRAVLEGCGYGLRQLFGLAQEVTGQEYHEYMIIGGGAKSDAWTQIKADITGKNIIALNVTDMAPIGAALLAGVGIKVYKDVYEASGKVKKTVRKKFYSNNFNRETYDKRYQVYISLYPQLKNIYRINCDIKQ